MDGHGVITLNGKDYPVGKGAGVYFGPGESAGIRPDGADGVKLIDAMKAIPTDDPLFGKGSIRADGRHIRQAAPRMAIPTAPRAFECNRRDPEQIRSLRLPLRRDHRDEGPTASMSCQGH